MRKRFLSVLPVILLAGAIVFAWLHFDSRLMAQPRPVQPRAAFSQQESAIIDLFNHVAPSVVQIAALPQGRSRAPGPSGAASGTGFVWDEAGHIVTNAHVVAGSRSLAVRFASGDVARAELVGAAPQYDLAVLKPTDEAKLPPPLSIGSSGDLKVGQMAFAIGNPFGLDQSLTTGIISALKRRIPTQNGREISNVIQTDAAINPGNSGGPLLDSAERLIGVNTAILSPSGSNAGIGFAVPVDTVNRVVPELIANGRVPTPGIGIVAADETVTARLGARGVVVFQANPGSPAQRAGIRGVDPASGAVGDVIVAADGKPVLRLSDLTDEIEQLGVGKPLQLQVMRSGMSRTVSVDIVDIGAGPNQRVRPVGGGVLR